MKKSPKPKKTPAKQLDAEIAESLAKAARFPSLRVTKVHPERVDEWYGVNAKFEWTTPFDVEAFHRATAAESRAWFDANPRQMHVGGFPLEKAIGEHIRREVARSSEWADFFAKTPRTQIARFTERDITDWGFDAHGGWASASTRDGE